MNLEPALVVRCQQLIQDAWLARLEGDHPQAQTYEREARQLVAAAGMLFTLAQFVANYKLATAA